MKIRDTRSTAPTPPVRAAASGGTAAYAAAALRDIRDSASIMGIPPAEMTAKVRDAIMTLMQEVERTRHELDIAQRRITELEKLADQDGLVHLANRRAFVRELSRMISFSARYDVPTSIAYFDVNDLKGINDSRGHAAGDAALLHVAGLLQNNTRESDIIGRLGGDEFAVILPNTTDETARSKAASLARIIEDTPMVWGDRKLRITVAHGAYSFQPGESADDALAEADRQMYVHKRSLKNEAMR